MSSHITLDQLLAHGACQPQIALFRKHFPTGSAAVTSAACLALAQVFNFGWVASNLLTPAALAHHEAARSTALARYDAAVRTALARYDAAVRTAQSWYTAAVRAAQAQYDAAVRTAQARYAAAVRTAQARYAAAVAVAFADAYLSQP